jgi:hypothetical protein
MDNVLASGITKTKPHCPLTFFQTLMSLVPSTLCRSDEMILHLLVLYKGQRLCFVFEYVTSYRISEHCFRLLSQEETWACDKTLSMQNSNAASPSWLSVSQQWRFFLGRFFNNICKVKL